MPPTGWVSPCGCPLWGCAREILQPPIGVGWRTPPDLLITTPESLYLMLTSAARSTLAGVEAVIIDEIHAMAATKRGSHLAVSLERLAHGREKPPQRIGLSATQRPLDEIATFLGGFQIDSDGRRRSRPVKIVDAGSRKPLDLEVVVPVQDMGSERSIWPAVHPALVDLVQQHHSTLVFVNARRSAERLAADLNETAGHDLVKAHHGSLAREQRLVIEDELKAGQLRALVATSSLELGIDMGAVDLVVQVGSPGSVAAGLQRIGRAGHQVGEPSRGRIFPATAATYWKRRWWPPGCGPVRSNPPAIPATRSMYWPSRWWRPVPSTPGASTTFTRWSGQRPRSST